MNHAWPGLWRQDRAASIGARVNPCTQRQIVTWSTVMPCSACSPSMSRCDRAYRGYRRTASVIMSGGNRNP